MTDPNSPDPSKRKSFFDEDSMDDGVKNHPPHPEQPIAPDRERMASRYSDDEDEYSDHEYDRRKSSFSGFMSSFGKGGGEGSSTTRRLTYVAGGIGGLLVVFIGGWMVFHSSHTGVPVFEPPTEVAKVKPANTGNVETIGMGLGDSTANNNTNNPNTPNTTGPEKANPQGLADQFNSLPPSRPVTPPKPAVPDHTATPAPSGNTNNTSPEDDETQSPSRTEHPKHQQSHQQPHHVTQTHNKPKSKKVVKQPEAHQAASGHFGVQLASLKTHEAAQAQWQTSKKKAPEVLGKYSPSIQKAEVNGNTVYRLRIKGLASKTQVNTLCSQLKAKGVACTIAY